MFTWYVGLLAVSGIAMIFMANVGNGQSDLARALNAVFGIGFLGYAGYLAFVFDGGSYLIFFQAFILPVLLAINFVKSTNWTALTTRPTPTQQAWRAYQREQQRG
ncbi:hypothetical protein ACFU44_33155 [Nocardia rhizosphaerihabitans]|uniref:hypothetical protein n=1 Tax=Nocardia rhizosphaerihabitans TaxID=1691570 RepID=UPI0036704027